MRKQHDRTEPTEHSEKKGTAAFTNQTVVYVKVPDGQTLRQTVDSLG